jgi:anti-anti-sigma regulatory factor
VLDALNAPDLRAVLLECVAEQPSAVVIDASDLEVDDDVALTVVSGVARQCEEWPGTRVALAGGSPDLDKAAERMGIARDLLVCPDTETALAQLNRVPHPPIRRERIEPDRNAPGVARFAVAEFCHGLGVPDHDAAQLVASELVTNAVVHAGTSIDLTLRFIAPLLHIAVRDRAGGVPHIAGIVDESSESGRGLVLVDALAARWGSFVPHRGKIVWAAVRVRPGRWNGKAPS